MRLELPNPSYNTLLCRQVLHANPVKSHIGELTLSLPRTKSANDHCLPGVCRSDQRVRAPTPASCLSRANKDSFHKFIETLCSDRVGSLFHLTGALHIWGGRKELRRPLEFQDPAGNHRFVNAAITYPPPPGAGPSLGLLWGLVANVGQSGWKGWMPQLKVGPGCGYPE